MEKRNKIIVIDFSIFMFRAIFAQKFNKQVPATYTCLNMILSCLRKIGVEPTDKIIVACDLGHSWRKELSKEYKADRKEQRDKHTDIDWEKMWKDFNQLIEDLQAGTHWRIVREWTFEADDWMAGACRYFKDDEVILITYDKDVEQLTSYPNVKLFSPLIKYKGKKGGYKLVEDPYKVLADKIQKETSDNLNSEIVTAEDYEIRKTIVSLLELPKHIEEKIQQTYAELGDKQNINRDRIPFRNSLKIKIINIYNDKKDVIDYKECIEYISKKRKGKKRKAKKKCKK